MDENVYKVPESNLERPHQNAETLFNIASRQRTLILSILMQILLNPVAHAAGIHGTAAFVVLTILSLGLLAFIVYTSVRLSALMNKVPVTVLLGIFAIVPVVNLIVLLILSRQSTGALKKAGVRVGLLGARLGDVPKA